MGRGAHLQDKKMAEIVNLSAETIIKALKSEVLSEEFRAELASKFVVKAMPTILDGNINGQQIIYVVNGARKAEILESDPIQVLPSPKPAINPPITEQI